MYSLKHGALPEMISPYMKRLIAETGGEDGPIGRQFIARPESESAFESTASFDPLIEEQHEVAPGVIYKYQGKLGRENTVEYYGRILWTISRYCATYCRFCFRGRMVGLPAGHSRPEGETLLQKPYLSDADIDQVIDFLKNHPEINEVILSGGDPLIVPQNYLKKIISGLTELQSNNHLDIIRIHTRAPVTNPESIKAWHLETLQRITTPYIVLHINHPAEITGEVVSILTRLRTECGATLLAQSVLLRGVNDDITVLQDLFNRMVKVGIRPYYLHYNDPVYWAKHFTVPVQEAIAIWRKLRPRLSGLAASAKFVIDTPYGYGKVPFPEGQWNTELTSFLDFNNVRHTLD